MGAVWVVVVLIGAFAVGAVGWPQIVGSLRVRQKRFMLPVVVWIAVLVAAFFLVRALLPGQIYAYLIGAGVALIMTLCTKRIE